MRNTSGWELRSLKQRKKKKFRVVQLKEKMVNIFILYSWEDDEYNKSSVVAYKTALFYDLAFVNPANFL